MKRTPLSIAILGAAATVAVLVAWQSWAGNPVTGARVATFIVTGLAIGGVLALAASGLVVTYTTSGIFNFAQGAIGMFMAFLYWELTIDRGWPALLALLLVVGVAAPVTGALLDKLLMRHLRDTPLVIQLAVTVGVLVTFVGVTGMIWSADVTRQVAGFFPGEGVTIAGATFTYHRLITIAAAAAAALGLRILLTQSRLGAAMRAVVDNRNLAAMNGIRPDRVSATAWAISTSLAALAGILVAPELGLAPEPLTLLIIDAFAAAIIGRLRSLPWTFAGAVLIGLLSGFALTFLDLSGRWTYARPAIPMLVLFAALLVLPPARLQTSRAAIRQVATGSMSARGTALGLGLLFAVVAVLSTVLGAVNTNRVSLGVATAILLMSLVPLTGWAGQVSLANFAFAGIGAVIAAKMGSDTASLIFVGGGSPLAIVAATVTAAAVGAVMSLPALRLQGLYLALATLAFARLVELLVYPQPEVFRGFGGGIGVRPLDLFGLQIDTPRKALLFLTACLCLVGVVVAAVRRGRFGRRLLAMRDSEAACATLGVNGLSTKLIVFTFSAGIAGFGGAMFAVYRGSSGGSIIPEDYVILAGLAALLLLVVGGLGTVSGAIVAAALTVVFLVLQNETGWRLFTTLTLIGPGLAVLGVVGNPSGVSSDLARLAQRLNPYERRRRRDQSPNGSRPSASSASPCRSPASTSRRSTASSASPPR